LPGASISGRDTIANPDCGDTTVFCAFVDVDNRVEESDVTNNQDCDSLCIGITEINVNIARIHLEDLPVGVVDTCEGIVVPNCDSALAVITVTDQNGFPIRGLADDCWSAPFSEWNQLNLFLNDPTYGTWVDMRTRTPLKMFTNNDLEEGSSPLSVAIVMDYSGSMFWNPDDIPTAEASVRNYVESGICADRFAIIKFGTNVQVKCDFTDYIDEVRSAISATYTGAGGTNILGAVREALTLVENDDPGHRHIIIVFTDGIDGSRIPMSQIIDYADLLNTPVFTIGIGTGANGTYLTNLAEPTGGLYRHVSSPEELEPLYRFFCNLASEPYYLHFKSEWSGLFDTLAVSVELNNDSTFNNPLTGADTLHYRSCAPICDLTVEKYSYGIEFDTLFGIPFADIGEVVQYRVNVRNLGHQVCACDPVRIIDYPPTWAGTVNCASVSPTPDHCDDDSIVWFADPSDIIFGSNYILQFALQVTDDEEVIDTNVSSYLINRIRVECPADENPDNNEDLDSVVVKRVPDPRIICENLNSTDPWPGDTAILSIFTYLPIHSVNWDVWLEGKCVQGSLPTIFSVNASDTLDRLGFQDTIILPELADGCNIGELWAFIEVRYDFAGNPIIYRDSCMLEVRRPPCRVRIDRNQINIGEEVMIEITQCEATDVRVQVIDISGGIVAEPLNTMFGQGMFKAYWDGKDDSGNPVNTGVYGILVDAGDERYTFKLAVTR